ncbi:MAG: FtsX-like permease family protein, partial [Clostridia bacterium]|nr:FtsX-like permease family protein [Clostridia bacterium]
IPYETMVNDKIPVEQIMIKFCNIENKNDLNTKFIAISKVFPDNTILTPISRNLKNEEYMMYQKAIILGMILWAIISYVYIYAYLIEKRQYVTDIYYICGCSKKKQAIMLFSEIILISVVQSVFSVLLYITILKRAIISIEPVMKFSLNCETYFTSFVINLLIATFVFVLMTKKIRKKSVLNKIRNEG